MLKKIIHSVVTTAFISQSLILSGCNQVGSAGGNSSQSNKLEGKTTKRLGDEIKDTTVWANVVEEAAKTTDSTLAFAINNGSHYQIEFVGCNNPSNISVTMPSYISPGYITTKTLDYFDKFDSLNYDKTGIYDKDSLYQASLHFSNMGKGNTDSFNCFYRILVPEAHQYLYFKQIFANKIVKDFDQPVNDAEAMQISASQQLTSAANGGGSLVISNKYNPLYNDILVDKQKEMVQEANKNLQEMYLYRWGEPFEQLQQDYLIEGMEKLALNEMLENGYTAEDFERVAKERDIVEIGFEQVDTDGDYYLTAKSYDKSSGKYGSVNLYENRADPLAKMIKKDDAIIKSKGHREYSPQSIVSDEISSDVSSLIISDLGDIEEIKLNDTISSEKKTAEVVRTDVDNSTILREKRAVPKAAKYEAADIAAMGFVGVTAALALTATIWRIVRVAHEDNNDVVTTSIAAITSDEANSWNALHSNDPAMQIKANAEFILDSQNSNTVNSGGLLRFAAGVDADPQFGILINQAELSTKAVPVSTDGDDPYRKADADAVLQLSFQDASYISAVDEEIFSMKRDAAKDMGYLAFAEDDRLNPPEVQLNSVIRSNSNSNGILYHGNGKLIPTKVNSIPSILGDSLILNQDEDITLGVKVPGNGFATAGRGLGVSFVGEDSTNGLVRFLPVKSMAYRQMIDSIKDYPVVPYLYSKFGCSIPEALDQSCSLTLHMGGYNDGKRHTGKLYIADSGSKSIALPVYINWRLITNQSEFPTLMEGDSTPQLLVVANVSNEDYTSIQVTGDLPGISNLVSGCDGGLKAGSECTLTFNLSSAFAGNYSLMVNGLKAGTDLSNIAEADKVPLTVNIAGGW